MQKYTILQLGLLEESIREDMGKEWDKKMAELTRRGLSFGSVHYEQVIQIGNKVIENCVDNLIRYEKTALFKNPPKNLVTYFTDLKEEVINLFVHKYTLISKKVEGMGSNNQIKDRYIQDVESLKNSFITSIKQKVDILQEELNLDLISTSEGSSINISGDVGVLNYQGQIEGNIEVNLGNSQSEEFKVAIQQIVEACKNSNETDDIKCKQLEGIEFLVEQSKKNVSERKPGLIEATSNYLSFFNNLSDAWAKYGPVISNFFGI